MGKMIIKLLRHVLHTEKNNLNLDPINGQIWTCGPRIHGLYYAKILQRILESVREHLAQILSLEIWESNFSKNQIMCTPNFLNFWNFETLKLWNLEILKFWNVGTMKLLNYILWRWGPGNDKDWFNKIEKSLDVNIRSIKNIKSKFDFLELIHIATSPYSHIAT